MEQKHYWDKASAKKEFTTPFHAEAFEKHVDKNAVVTDKRNTERYKKYADKYGV